MKSDAYTKVVLTIIASLLAWQCVMRSMPSVAAQESPQRVVIVGLESPLKGLPVLLVSQSGVPLNEGEQLRVVLGLGTRTQAVPVALWSIVKPTNPRTPWDAIQVDVPKAQAAKVPGH